MPVVTAFTLFRALTLGRIPLDSLPLPKGRPNEEARNWGPPLFVCDAVDGLVSRTEN
jgi:hypothetical protein